MPTLNTIDDYIAQFPIEVQRPLQELRATIRLAAPLAEEVISYGMPALKQNRVLVYFAAAKKHIGFYPTPSAVTAFAEKLRGFKTSKATVQFPLGEVLPLPLIVEMVHFRLLEDQQFAKKKKA